jgi:hypothetical protein
MKEYFYNLENELSKYQNKNLTNNKNRSNCSGISHKVQHGQDKVLGRYRNIGNQCDSSIFGVTKKMFCKKKDAFRLCQSNKKYPEIYQAILELGTLILPEDFEYNQICLNKNFKCNPHVDGNNLGESYIVAFGDYSGGDLQLYDSNDRIININIKYQLFKFNGSKIKHGTQDFTGNRYSLVFYNFPV